MSDRVTRAKRHLSTPSSQEEPKDVKRSRKETPCKTTPTKSPYRTRTQSNVEEQLPSTSSVPILVEEERQQPETIQVEADTSSTVNVEHEEREKLESEYDEERIKDEIKRKADFLSGGRKIFDLFSQPKVYYNIREYCQSAKGTLTHILKQVNDIIDYPMTKPILKTQIEKNINFFCNERWQIESSLERLIKEADQFPASLPYNKLVSISLLFLLLFRLT